MEGAEAMGLAEVALIPCSAGTPACHTLGLAPAPFETLKTITSFCGRAGASPRPAEGLCSRRVSIFNVFMDSELEPADLGPVWHEAHHDMIIHA